MSGRTISEKILSRASGRDARAGDVVVCDVDCAMGTDGSVPMALDYFHEMGGSRVFDPARILFVFDHYAPDPSSPTFELQARARAFATMHGIPRFECGEGICHQLMVESGRTRPGRLLVGADSHSVTGGALNAFATGIGSSDLAATLLCGRIWLKVPETIRVVMTGRRSAGVYAKDVALALTGVLGADGAAYRAIEFAGPAVADLEIDDRLVLCNMSVEMGAKAAIFCADGKTFEYLRGRPPWPPAVISSGRLEPDDSARAVEADTDAVYIREVPLDLGSLGPAIARPHAVDNVAEIGAEAGVPIQMVFIGTCTGGRAGDIREAARILFEAGRIAPGVQVVISPASREVERELRTDGTLDRLASLGALIVPSGCGPCCGTAPPIPADGAKVISTANRNFKARMGNASASIYLASPAACAAAAVTGQITDPRQLE